MVTVDYTSYLDQQNAWARILTKQAIGAEAEDAKKLGELAGAALRRLVSVSQRRVYDVPPVPQRKTRRS